jgi:hypothetical protein
VEKSLAVDGESVVQRIQTVPQPSCVVEATPVIPLRSRRAALIGLAALVAVATIVGVACGLAVRNTRSTSRDVSSHERPDVGAGGALPANPPSAHDGESSERFVAAIPGLCVGDKERHVPATVGGKCRR